jgi:Trk K+ transport system NAD-binding subunit
LAFEITVPAGSPAAGLTVMEAVRLPGFPASCVFAALYQADGGVEAARGSAVVQAGTTVLLVSRADDVGKVVETLTATTAASR